ncbi:AAA family ATPase [Vibrio parahaemolyticus]|uniref:AAA family ATPase n=2 Tax=Vibrio parahaemolyticus TaxID=670 RepID=UPI00193E232C|nr:ATP-binding protein [Vibrio parahaemolyticus]EJG0940750.1 ATP-binding protein [Vibrio parahaemolyticus O1]ELK2256398.1 ATP-binding protein [Vibrio vulnificus]MBM4882764.1 ATP-binding protein [Vibrio parahaemolyticus]HCG7378547.1 ATP-binding protein [Vibrio parahaemolyticus]HCG8518920.1 ATP-binding protein [Vibrio parahaemolyticus]
MTKIYFVCGFIGSGKTTYSKALAEKHGAFLFSIDEWMIPLYGEHMEREVFDSRLATLQELFKDSALQLFSLGVPVIFDFGFWRKADRDTFTDWASKVGVDSEIHYLDVLFDICKQRALARNSELGGKSYKMTLEMLELFWSWFEIPAPNEGVVWVQRKT